MALTLEHEQKLKDAGLTDFFESNPDPWVQMARRTYQFLQGEFPANTPPRPDDVAKILLPILEVNTDLQEKLDDKNLSQKYWLTYFADLILDRRWTQIQKGN